MSLGAMARKDHDQFLSNVLFFDAQAAGGYIRDRLQLPACLLGSPLTKNADSYNAFWYLVLCYLSRFGRWHFSDG